MGTEVRCFRRKLGEEGNRLFLAVLIVVHELRYQPLKKVRTKLRSKLKGSLEINIMTETHGTFTC